MLVLAVPLGAQEPVERVRCQLLSFRVLQAAKGGLIDPRFLQVFEEGAQRAALHAALAPLPQLEMLPLGADTALVARSEPPRPIDISAI